MKKLSSAIRAIAARTEASVGGLNCDHEGKIAPVRVGKLQDCVDRNISAASAVANCAMIPARSSTRNRK